jgi:hypothetical protein
MLWLIIVLLYVLLYLSMACAERGHHTTSNVCLVVVFIVNFMIFADIIHKMGCKLGVL